jgi:hypothetical protein
MIAAAGEAILVQAPVFGQATAALLFFATLVMTDKKLA